VVKITAAQVAGVVTVMGPPEGTSVAEWVAKARQESQFRTDVQDYLNSDHWGLWQISANHHDAPGMFDNNGKDSFRESIKSPGPNFYAAKALYAKSNWRPWLASGGRPSTTQADRDAAANPDMEYGHANGDIHKAGIGDLIDEIPGLPDPVASLNDVLNKFLDPLMAAAKWIGNAANWIRIVQVGAGVALGIAAVSIVARPYVEDATSTFNPFK